MFKKKELFNGDCLSDVKFIEIKVLNHICKDEDIIDNCKEIDA